MTGTTPEADATDSLTLRFRGQDEDGTDLQELSAAHVAEVLQGIVGLASDFAKAGAFGDGIGGGEVLVKPPREGSFIIEVIRMAQDHPYVSGGLVGSTPPSLGSVLWWATKSARASVSDFEHLENGNVKVMFQDETVQEIPLPAWEELNKRRRRRKKQLRQILAPLSDERVSELEVINDDEVSATESEPAAFVLGRDDYNAVRPEDEVEEVQQIFEAEAQMSAIDFDDPTKWRVKTIDATRSATVQDEDFLGRIAGGLPIRKSDIFRLRIREDTVTKNGQTRRHWTVLKVESYRRASHDDGDA